MAKWSLHIMFVIHSTEYDHDPVIWCKDVNLLNAAKEGNWSTLTKQVLGTLIYKKSQ